LDLQIIADGLSGENVDRILKAAPQVAFLDLGEEPTGVGGIETLAHEDPDLALVVAGPALSADGLLAVMRAGATEYLPRPVSQEDARQAFLRVRRKAKPGSQEGALAVGQVTTVFSSKGGTGVTTVATKSVP
jgi:pilus assembly protein CpaE